jgi:hypothetical protein
VNLPPLRRAQPPPQPQPGVLGYVIGRTDGDRTVLTHASVQDADDATAELAAWRQQPGGRRWRLCEVREVT